MPEDVEERFVEGFHGTSLVSAVEILATGQFLANEKDYHWLGNGIYFWESSSDHAWMWAERLHGRGQAAVLQARIKLGKCLDLADTRYAQLVRFAFEDLRRSYQEQGKELPENDKKAHRLDCMVLNYLYEHVFPFDTARSPFFEGKPLYEGTQLSEEQHIQICVRNPSCITGSIRFTLRR